MSPTQRFFYVVYVLNGEFQAALDALRLIADPRSRFPAHITIRGPYSESIDVTSYSERIRGSIVRVADVGRFFGDGQNTVFLHVSCPDFLSVWDKADYGYNPHVTLYDGDSGAFAEALREVVKRHPIRYAFRARGLEPLVSVQGDPQSPIRAQFDSTALAAFQGERLTLEEIDSMGATQRLEWIDRLAQRLAHFHKATVPVRVADSPGGE